jgi:SOS-response transcriptional repressor LexA
MDATWTRIEEELARRGRGWQWLADQMGMKIQRVQNWKTRGVPKGAYPDLAAALGKTMDWVAGIADEDRQAAAASPALPLPVGAANLRAVAMVPIVGTTQGGPPDRASNELSYPAGDGASYVEVATADPHAYGLRVVGDSMAPRIMEGEWIVVEPSTEPLPGDEVVVKTRDGEVMVKVLSARHGNTVTLSSVNEAFKRVTKLLSEIEFIHYVGPRLPARAVKTRAEATAYQGPDRRAGSQAAEVERRSTIAHITGEGPNQPYSRRKTTGWGSL